MTDYEKKNVTRGGGQKSAPKVSRIIWMAPNTIYYRVRKYQLTAITPTIRSEKNVLKTLDKQQINCSTPREKFLNTSIQFSEIHS